MNYCVDCKWVSPLIGMLDASKCKHPNMLEVDQVSGKKQMQFCSVCHIINRGSCPYFEYSPRKWWQIWRKK